MLHNDLNPTSFLFEEGQLTGLVDFERARSGDPHYDLVKVFQRGFGDDPELISAFCSGYSLDFENRMIRELHLFYRRLYSLDMAVYLKSHGNTLEDRRLLEDLKFFLGHPALPY